MRIWWLRRAGFGLLFVALAVIVFGGAVMLLWNALMPELFHLPAISFWQSVGLIVLSHILLRGPGGWHRGGWKRDRWRHRMEEKLASMTPEERERFKQEWGHRCGPWGREEKESSPPHQEAGKA